MTDATDVATRYLDAFNETDAASRAELVSALYTTGCTYTDPHVELTGPAQIAEFIGQTQARFPGHRFALRGEVDAHHDQARFQWQAGPPEEPDRFVGFDVIVCEGDRIGRVLGFMDAAPQG